jgi:hypothetical protein
VDNTARIAAVASRNDRPHSGAARLGGTVRTDRLRSVARTAMSRVPVAALGPGLHGGADVPARHRHARALPVLRPAGATPVSIRSWTFAALVLCGVLVLVSAGAGAG